MKPEYWGLCESCRNSVDTGPTIECGFNLKRQKCHYEPVEEHESNNERTEKDYLPF